MTELGPLRGPGVLGTGLLGREGQAGPGGRRKDSEGIASRVTERSREALRPRVGDRSCCVQLAQ